MRVPLRVLLRLEGSLDGSLEGSLKGSLEGSLKGSLEVPSVWKNIVWGLALESYFSYVFRKYDKSCVFLNTIFQ